MSKILNTRINKTALLITMYIGSSIERKKMYETNVLDWLNNTPFEVYTVDSSNHKLDIIHPRLHQFYFDQGYTQLIKNPSIAEKNSLLHLLDYYPEIYSYDFIFKITGKYYCPNFMEQFQNIPHNVDIVLQYGVKAKSNFYKIILSIFLGLILIFIDFSKNYRLRILNYILTVILIFIWYHIFKTYYWENTELVGMKPLILKIIVGSISDTPFEVTLFKYISSHSKLVTYRLQPLIIKTKIQRSDNSILDEL